MAKSKINIESNKVMFMFSNSQFALKIDSFTNIELISLDSNGLLFLLMDSQYAPFPENKNDLKGMVILKVINVKSSYGKEVLEKNFRNIKFQDLNKICYLFKSNTGMIEMYLYFKNSFIFSESEDAEYKLLFISGKENLINKLINHKKEGCQK